MRAQTFIAISAVLAVLLLLVPAAAADTIYIYGYVSYGDNPVNGAPLVLSGPFSGHQTATSHNNGTNPGYYEFVIENGSKGGYTVNASYNGSYGVSSFIVSGPSNYRNVNIPKVAPTAVPTLTATPTVTPKPSHEPGGLVVRNDSSSFVPMAPQATTTPVPRLPTPTPTIKPANTTTPTPTAAADHGLLSNVYVWLLAALIMVTLIAVAVLIYIRK